jgi:D-alanyl-D-alanine dipeptidase
MASNEMYQSLEKRFPKYNALKLVTTVESCESLVSLDSSRIEFSTMLVGIEPSTKGEIYVRSTVLQKLELAQTYLDENFPDLCLQVFYGWRSPAIQTRAFLLMKKQLSKSFSVDIDDIHKFIAAPDVAGHPTGGAVDVRLISKRNEIVDMGTRPHEFSVESYVFSPDVSNMAWKNRQLLRAAMMFAGFAPFDGEWWHFSYGDKEWAYFWNRPCAIYDQIELM